MNVAEVLKNCELVATFSIVKKLSKFELDKIYKTIRSFQDYQKNELRPLVGYINWLEKRISELEKSNDKLTQKSAFDSMDKETRIQAQYERQQNYFKEKHEPFDKAKMFFDLKNAGKLVSPEWERLCKWFQLSDHEAIALADSYKGG